MKKLLTLVIPTYNMEKYLHTCLNSLIIGEGQELLEVLVINDGSKDSSSTIAHEYETKIPESFRVIDKENGNYGSCINRGLKEATGKYIKILDADDYFDTSSLKIYLQKLQIIDVDLVLTDNTIFGDNDISKKRYGFPFPEEEVLSFEDYCSHDAFKANIQMHNVTYRTSLFKDLDYHQTEGISYTDMEWIFLPMSHVKTFVYYALPLYFYLVGREGQTIAPQQMKKCAEHRSILVNDMLNHYVSADKTNLSILTYLDFMLSRQAKELYKIYLAAYPDMDLTKIIEVDKKLKCMHPAIYESTGQRTMGPFIRIKYVNYWRRHNYAPQPKYFFVLFNLYNKALLWSKKILKIHHV